MRYPALRLITVLSYLLAAVSAVVVFVVAQRELHVLIAAALAILASLGTAAVADVLRLMMDAEESLRFLRGAAPSQPQAGSPPDPAVNSGDWKARVEEWFLR